MAGRLGTIFFWLCRILAVLSLLVALVSGASLLFGFSTNRAVVFDALTLASFTALIFFVLGWSARAALRKRG